MPDYEGINPFSNTASCAMELCDQDFERGHFIGTTGEKDRKCNGGEETQRPANNERDSGIPDAGVHGGSEVA